MFDQIDAAYYRLRAGEEREKAQSTHPKSAEKHRRRAFAFEEKARLILAPNAGTHAVVFQGA